MAGCEMIIHYNADSRILHVLGRGGILLLPPGIPSEEAYFKRVYGCPIQVVADGWSILPAPKRLWVRIRMAWRLIRHARLL